MNYKVKSLLLCLAVMPGALIATNELQTLIPIKQDLEIITQKPYEGLIQKFAPPEKVSKCIEKNKDKLRFGCIIEDESGSYICKGYGKDAVSRVINAYYCKKVIEKHNLDRLEIPQKYVCEIDGKLWVFAEHIKQTKENYNFSNEDIRQLAFFATQTNFVDWYLMDDLNNHNIIINDENQKLMIIDTEYRSFQFFNIKKELSKRIQIKTPLREYLKKYEQLLLNKQHSMPEITNVKNELYDLIIDFEKIIENRQQRSFL